jgi:hypothetical protein
LTQWAAASAMGFVQASSQTVHEEVPDEVFDGALSMMPKLMSDFIHCREHTYRVFGGARVYSVRVQRDGNGDIMQSEVWLNDSEQNEMNVLVARLTNTSFKMLATRALANADAATNWLFNKTTPCVGNARVFKISAMQGFRLGNPLFHKDAAKDDDFWNDVGVVSFSSVHSDGFLHVNFEVTLDGAGINPWIALGNAANANLSQKALFSKEHGQSLRKAQRLRDRYNFWRTSLDDEDLDKTLREGIASLHRPRRAYDC